MNFTGANIKVDIIKRFDANETITPDWLINNLEKEPLKHIVSKLVIKEASLIDIHKTLQNCMQRIKTTSLTREIEILNTKIKEAEEGKDENAIKQFLVYKQKLLERKKEFISEHAAIHLQ